ncbi:dirigent protein 25 [Cinnamomum micranthum f. kanehirae]|uniref:Dirigent protein n=1 Tax=Cinnamomum micranthum f. kanehirae TaxID=337451 RepID=A0A3S3R529_9MAGN|nr:dirigent protein 25 [Cinnamomum micranthum f. kanehirae]
MAILKATFCLLLLAIATTCATSARILDEESSPVTAPVAAPASDPAEAPAADVVPDSSNPVVAPVATSPPGVAPITAPQTIVNGANPSATVVAPVADATSPPVVAPITAPQTIVNGATPASATVVAPVTDATSPPAVAPTTASQTTVNGAAPASATVGNSDPHHPLSFFMHDVLGGSNPSAKAVTGVVTNSAVNGQIPFAKPNGAIIPANNGVPITNSNSGTINNNNLPFLAGLGGPTSNTLLQNNGNGNGGNGNGLPFLTTGQLPSGTSIQQLLFGTMTVIDDELTEGHELASAVVGKAQGFYVASSEDGTSQTMAFTVMFESGHYMDTISFFGVHRTQSSESYLGVMGGTGKYVNAKGFANVKTIHPTGDQHATDGAETLLEFTVYLS